MDPHALVHQLGTDRRLDAMRALVGSANARELRSVVVADDVLEALVDGLADPSPPVRF